jgi:hypothetical protein
MVLTPEGLSDASGIPKLIRLVLPKPDRERDDGTARRFRHQGHDETGVEPSGQHCAQRDVAHESIRDGLTEKMQQLVGVVLQRARPRVWIRLRIGPVRLFVGGV